MFREEFISVYNMYWCACVYSAGRGGSSSAGYQVQAVWLWGGAGLLGEAAAGTVGLVFPCLPSSWWYV